jgi:glutamine amidotransferase
MSERAIKAAIVDYGLGNLFSVKHACTHIGLDAEITSDRESILNADVILLPGVGAYRDAMENLHKLDLVRPLQDISQVPHQSLVGICLGQQLLMTESFEFGRHAGLDIIPGEVVRFEQPVTTIGLGSARHERRLKVPQIGWNRICALDPAAAPNQAPPAWRNTPLDGVENGAFMYFVHSYYTVPASQDVILSTSTYGGITFCSSMQLGNVFTTQFHPERSTDQGLTIYRNIAAIARERAALHT